MSIQDSVFSRRPTGASFPAVVIRRYYGGSRIPGQIGHLWVVQIKHPLDGSFTWVVADNEVNND